MNNTELITQVAGRSGIPAEDCRQVIDALEEVFADGLAEKQWKASLFEKTVSIVERIRTKKEKRKTNQ